MKICNLCKKTKPMSEFQNKTKAPDGKAYACKPCCSARNKIYQQKRDPALRDAWVVNSVEARRMSMRTYKYGITKEQYKELLLIFGEDCCICTKKFKGTPHIDHDHTTGKIRGLICRSCNAGLGLFKDDVDSLARAIIYLNQSLAPPS